MQATDIIDLGMNGKMVNWEQVKNIQVIWQNLHTHLFWV